LGGTASGSVDRSGAVACFTLLTIKPPAFSCREY
jgi:hypothetical protein